SSLFLEKRKNGLRAFVIFVVSGHPAATISSFLESPMRRLLSSFALCVLATAAPAAQPAATVTAIRAGRLLDPEAGRILTNQVIVVEGARIRDVGPNVAIPPGARVID